MPELASISSKEAQQLLEEDSSTQLIDVRSSMEFLFVGHPVGAVHIAWIDDPDWEVNTDFANEVESLVKKKSPDFYINSPIILICRSGVRTKEAGNVLIEAGFKNVMFVDEGFEGERNKNDQRSTVGGWRYHGMPWKQC